VSRPRLLLCGPPGCGQAQLAAALLYALEGLPAHAIGLPALLSNPGARSPEEALVWAYVEARRWGGVGVESWELELGGGTGSRSLGGAQGR
jgi:hypothetical protein